MDEVILRENLPENTAQQPRKKVQIMVCADFEDSSDPQEKFFSFVPVPIDELPPFRLCHKIYWDEEKQNAQTGYNIGNKPARSTIQEIRDAERTLLKKTGATKVIA